mmetsp:Transcript_107137/g.311100  ORF Transcript_107137/g.311100 Transcript_107137/m.311100 type:complete len:327 (-) Transcript_107137:446-1426(-)
MMKANIDKLGDDDGKLEASDGLSAVVKLGVVIVALVFIRNYMLATKIRAHLKNSRELERANQTYQDMVVELNSKVEGSGSNLAKQKLLELQRNKAIEDYKKLEHALEKAAAQMPSVALVNDLYKKNKTLEAERDARQYRKEAAAPSEIALLNRRIEDLEAENADLRRQKDAVSAHYGVSPSTDPVPDIHGRRELPMKLLTQVFDLFDGDQDNTMDGEEFIVLVGTLMFIKDGYSVGFEKAKQFAVDLSRTFCVVDCEGEVVERSKVIESHDFVNNSHVGDLVAAAYSKHEMNLLEELRRVFEEVICEEWPDFTEGQVGLAMIIRPR